MMAQISPRRPETEDNALVKMCDVGVRYRFLTQRYTTLKGRLLGLLQRDNAPPAEFWALRGVTLEARPGDVVGLVGPNGAGKSTILRVLAGILPPTEGHVETRGDVRPVLDVMGTLNAELTGRQNCYLYGALNRIPKRDMHDVVARVADFSELDAFFDVPVKCYSSGMAARLGFSLAVQVRPEILLLDEILGVGDEHFQKKSHFKMMKLIDRGTIVVIASHNLAFVEQVCSTAALVWGGSIHGKGRPKEIIRQYRAMSP
jgi:ABC-type polysaccharide/polyol phosphate transport system ATPase subunit